jgi:apolipoprotein N-acyltransferase
MSSNFFGIIGAAILLAAPFLLPTLFPLAWVAFMPLFFVLERAKSLRSAILQGWLMGSLAHLIGFHWLTYTISAFGGFPYPVSVIIFLVYAALQGLQMALFALLVRGVGFGPLGIFPALFWVPLEFLYPLLFPWYLANSQVDFFWLVQSADLVGPYGTGFIVMWCNAAIYLAVPALRPGGNSTWVPLAYSGLALLAALIYGYQRLEVVAGEIAGARKVAIGAVQGNVDIDMKWNPVLAQRNLDQHRKLTDELGAVPLIIWPESAIEATITEDLQVLPLEVMPQFKAERAAFIFGAKSIRGRPGRSDVKAFNTAFFTDAKGRILGRYHKQVLLAFGEYLPFKKILSLLPAIPLADGFTPGAGPVAFHVGRGLRLAPLICYEDLMPELARRFVSQTRANLLINLTNDAWYGKSVGPWQHLRLAQSRAIETRRSLLRVTNTGVTSLVDARGAVVKTLPMFTAATLEIEVDILSEETFYVRFGDWFAWGITLMAAAIALIHLKRSWQAV